MHIDIKDYPFGDGRADCPMCQGRGVVYAPPKPGRIVVGERTVPCGCILERDILHNVERGWCGLTKADPIPTSPLKGHEGENLWITAGHKTIREHLRHVAIRQGPKWSFNVVSDADLMDSWLARIDDDDIIDGDVGQMRRQPITSKYGALVDMVEPPELLVMIMGIKAARNSAMPEVVLEALQHRAYKNKVTWVVDQPEYRLATGHISHSGSIVALIDKWHHIDLGVKANDNGPMLQRRSTPPSSASTQEPAVEDDDPEWMKDAVDKLDNGKKKFRRHK